MPPNQEIIDAVYAMVLAEMQGVILMWSGTIATIPDGWVLCDGFNGTPDLRSNFVVGARQDDAGVPKAVLLGALVSSGGSDVHDHVYDSGSHAHYSRASYTVDLGFTRQVWDYESPNNQTDVETTGGITNDNIVIPVPFFALAYIMKT